MYHQLATASALIITLPSVATMAKLTAINAGLPVPGLDLNAFMNVLVVFVHALRSICLFVGKMILHTPTAVLLLVLAQLKPVRENALVNRAIASAQQNLSQFVVTMERPTTVHVKLSVLVPRLHAMMLAPVVHRRQL